MDKKKEQKYPKSWQGTPEEWENLCNRCGGCCHNNMILRKATVSYLDDSVKCRFLTEDNLCRVYPDRFKHTDKCENITELVRTEVIPNHCAYAPYCERTKPHFDAWSPEELEEFIRQQPDIVIRAALRLFGLRAALMTKE